jgi:hypothetical protein
VLGILATYNFIKDPLPESSMKADKVVEFEDPRRLPQPLALAPRRQLSTLARKEDAASPPRSKASDASSEAPRISVGAAAPDAPGLFIGGKF